MLNEISVISNDAVTNENEADIDEIDIDEFLDRAGGCGLYQFLLVSAIILIGIPLVFPPFLFYFIGHDPLWITSYKVPANETFVSSAEIKWRIHHGDDDRRCALHRYEWEYYYSKSSLVTEFNLVCEHSWLLALTGSIVFLGWGFGSILMGYLSDKYGRKTILIPSLFFDLLCLLLHYFISSIYLLIVVRFIMGVFHAGASLNKFVLVVEVIGPEFRVLGATVSELSWVAGTVIMSVSAYLINDWRWLCMILSAPFIVTVLIACMLPESVRWLNIHGKTDIAEGILKQIAKTNKKAIRENVRLIPNITTGVEKKHYTYADFFRNWNIVFFVTEQGYLWFNAGMVYFTMSWAFADIGGNLYVNFIIAIVVEIPVYLLATPILNRFGRKKTTCMSFFVVIVACVTIGILLFIDFPAVRLGVALIGKCAIALAFMALYMWSSELYPTVLRTQGMGINIITSRIGAAVSPFVKILEHFHASVPFLLMVVSTLIALFLALLLPETMDKPTREKYEDINLD